MNLESWKSSSCSMVEFRGTKIQTRHVGRIGRFFFQNPWKLTRMTSGRIME